MTHELHEWEGMLHWRFVGPWRGGRAMAVAGHPYQRNRFFFGTSGGGVWRSDDGGAYWRNVSDEFFKRSSIGALAIAPSDPNVMYVGTGECGLRTNITYGDGVYRSDDGGATWQQRGLAATHNIARVRVHPHDADLVYVAAFGHRFGTNAERGVYRSRDGGTTWQQILFIDEHTGAIDLWLDPTNPRVVYAATWQALLQPWGRTSRGAGSGLYRSHDGGDTWTPLHDRPGFPGGVRGRIAVCSSPAQPERVWALVDAEQGGVYRSDNNGASWTWLSNDRNFLVRSWYFTHLVPDPRDSDTLYMPGRKLWQSVDGGRSFRQLNTPYVDHHDLWVDPQDTQRMIVANDGGAAVSYNTGLSWSPITNQPTAELYHAAADSHFPYRVYGSQQDNSTLAMPSRSDRGPISQMEWYDVGGGESGFIAVRPDDPNIVYAGDLPGLGITRYDHRTHQIREICPWSEMDGATATGDQYRFNWSTPIVLSPHAPHALYVAGNKVFRSADEGMSWSTISPDLTRNDRVRLERSGGSPTGENSIANDYCTISSFAESSVVPGMLWAGSDDGLVHCSRDDGATWSDVTPADLPIWSTTAVEPSPHDAASVYVSATAHQLDDMRPMTWRSDDYGASWTAITHGLPDDVFVRVVRADPSRRGLLYAATETGVHMSLTNGDSWQPFQLNLPVVAVYDLCIHQGDLIAATHGRGLWMVDDLSPVHQLADATTQAPVHLFAPRPAVRVAREAYGLDSLVTLYNQYAAANPPTGIVVSYWLREPVEGTLALQLIDAAGRVVSELTNQRDLVAAAPIGPYDHQLVGGAAVLTGSVAGEAQGRVTWGAQTLPAPSDTVLSDGSGFHRAVLPLTYPPAAKPPRSLVFGITAPLALPGIYEVRLVVGDQQWSHQVEIRPDPRLATTADEYAAQFDLMFGIRDTVSAITDALTTIYERYQQYAGDADTLARLRNIERALSQPDLDDRSGELAATELASGLDHKLEALGYAVARADHPPTRQMHALFADLHQRVAQQLAALHEM